MCLIGFLGIWTNTLMSFTCYSLSIFPCIQYSWSFGVLENHDNDFDSLELNHFIVNEHRSASSTHSLREWNEDDVDVLVNARVSKPLLLLWGMVCHYNWFLCILFFKFSIRVVNLCFNQDNTFLSQSNIHNLICHVPVQLPSIGRGEICQDTGSWVPRHLFCF